MGQQDVSVQSDENQLQAVTRALLADVRALERMLAEGRFESGIRRVGAEQEMFLVDATGRPAMVGEQVLERLDRRWFTTELARFNLEANLDPQVYGADCLYRMENQLRDLLGKARSAARSEGSHILLTGILPTLQAKHLGLDAMTPNPRYVG